MIGFNTSLSSASSGQLVQMGGGDGEGKSHGKGSAKGKGAGKSGVVPAVGAGPLIVSDAAWAQMSGKRRKL